MWYTVGIKYAYAYVLAFPGIEQYYFRSYSSTNRHCEVLRFYVLLKTQEVIVVLALVLSLQLDTLTRTSLCSSEYRLTNTNK